MSLQHETHETPEPQTAPLREDGPAALDALSLRSAAELETSFRAGQAPDSLAVLEGRLCGRILALEGIGQGALAGLVRLLAGLPLFPWWGKSFQAFGDDRGQGANLWRVWGEHLPFDVRLEGSLLDGRPCVSIDYDRSENPAWVRRLRDEVREVAPGVFLGPSFVRGRFGIRRLLFFACVSS